MYSHSRDPGALSMDHPRCSSSFSLSASPRPSEEAAWLLLLDIFAWDASSLFALRAEAPFGNPTLASILYTRLRPSSLSTAQAGFPGHQACPLHDKVRVNVPSSRTAMPGC